MSKPNSLVGLIANYGDSDDDSDDGIHPPGVEPEPKTKATAPAPPQGYVDPAGAVHPAPITHCPWSACYDESSGFTYYWNQQTNAVTWEAPPEYLLALKLAQQQHVAGSAEVSAEEWQLYQQALAEKQNTQNKVIAKTAVTKKTETNNVNAKKSKTAGVKRGHSDDEDEKIELITSYSNTDSDSNDDTESPTKLKVPKAPKVPKVPVTKSIQSTKSTQPKQTNGTKKPKLKPVEYGPVLPPNQNYTVPIGPELPPEISEPIVEEKVSKSVEEETASPKPVDDEDENSLLIKLKDKAKILEKLGGEIPKELQKMIDDNGSRSNTPKRELTPKLDTNIDDLLAEIEQKELPKSKKASNSRNESPIDSPRHTPPPQLEVKPLLPSAKNIEEIIPVIETEVEKKETTDKKGANLYLTENIDTVSKKKLRISNSVLPKKETPTAVYTTKYSQFIEGFSSERTGLGFSKMEDDDSPKINSPKGNSTVAYGNGLLFTKGEVLNEKDEDLDDLTDLLEVKLKYLNDLQPSNITPVQEMLIQMQTLVSAFRSGALSSTYWRRWANTAHSTLLQHEQTTAPSGWRLTFLRSEARYGYRREADGFLQWEYPVADTDMDISTTPPHTGIEPKEELEPSASPPATPPPPAWSDPPPPGCDLLPLPTESKQEIGDELASFYNDIAQLDQVAPAASSPEHTDKHKLKSKEADRRNKEKERERENEREREREREREKVKKKSKVKISSSIGLKHKSVSNLVAKWQQVAEEIHSD